MVILPEQNPTQTQEKMNLVEVFEVQLLFLLLLRCSSSALHSSTRSTECCMSCLVGGGGRGLQATLIINVAPESDTAQAELCSSNAGSDVSNLQRPSQRGSKTAAKRVRLQMQVGQEKEDRNVVEQM